MYTAAAFLYFCAQLLETREYTIASKTCRACTSSSGQPQAVPRASNPQDRYSFMTRNSVRTSLYKIILPQPLETSKKVCLLYILICKVVQNLSGLPILLPSSNPEHLLGKNIHPVELLIQKKN